MAQQYFYTSDAVQTTLVSVSRRRRGPVDGGKPSRLLVLDSGRADSFPAPMLLEWGTVNQERVTLTQAATGGGPFTFANCVRGDDGTAAPAHGIGAAVIPAARLPWTISRPPPCSTCARTARTRPA